MYVIYSCNTAEDASGQRGIWKEYEDLFKTFAVAQPEKMPILLHISESGAFKVTVQFRPVNTTVNQCTEYTTKMPPGPALRFLPQGSWTTPSPGVELCRPSHGQLQFRPPVLLESPLQPRPMTFHPFYWIPARLLILRMSKGVHEL